MLQVFSYAKYLIASGGLDLLTDTLTVALLMSNTTAGNANQATVQDVANLENLDEFDGGGGYTRQTLASKTVTHDTSLKLAKFDAADTLFGNITGGSRSIVGALLLFGSVPIAFMPLPDATEADGTAFTIEWPPGGILQFA